MSAELHSAKTNANCCSYGDESAYTSPQSYTLPSTEPDEPSAEDILAELNTPVKIIVETGDETNDLPDNLPILDPETASLQELENALKPLKPTGTPSRVVA